MLLKFSQCLFLFVKKQKNKILAILIIGVIDCILWVIRYQIGNRYTTGLFFLIIIIKFIMEGASGYLMYSSIEVIISLTII